MGRAIITKSDVGEPIHPAFLRIAELLSNSKVDPGRKLNIFYDPKAGIHVVETDAASIEYRIFKEVKDSDLMEQY